MSIKELEMRLERLAQACTALHWELKGVLSEGDRLPVDLAISLQILDGKAELSGLILQRFLGEHVDTHAVAGQHAAETLAPPPTGASVVDRISHV